MDDLIRIDAEFPTEEACLDYLEAMRWPAGVRCPHCGADGISRIATQESVRSKTRPNKQGLDVAQRIPARRLFQCLKCGRQFNSKTGTVFSDTRLPLRKWFHAIALVAGSGEAISARRLQRELKIGYQTAWHLCHRIQSS